MLTANQEKMDFTQKEKIAVIAHLVEMTKMDGKLSTEEKTYLVEILNDPDWSIPQSSLNNMLSGGQAEFNIVDIILKMDFGKQTIFLILLENMMNIDGATQEEIQFYETIMGAIIEKQKNN